MLHRQTPCGQQAFPTVMAPVDTAIRQTTVPGSVSFNNRKYIFVNRVFSESVCIGAFLRRPLWIVERRPSTCECGARGG